MVWKQIEIICSSCNGTGKILTSIPGQPPSTEIKCPTCEGNKYIPFGRIDMSGSITSIVKKGVK